MPAPIDLSACCEVTSVFAKKFATGVAQDLNDADKIDIGRYEYVWILFSCSDVGTAITLTMTPKEADTRTGPEFPLDGTNGAPNFVRTASTGVLGTGWAYFPTSGRRRFLQIAIATTGGSGNAAASCTVIGVLRGSEAVLRPFTLTGVVNTGVS